MLESYRVRVTIALSFGTGLLIFGALLLFSNSVYSEKFGSLMIGLGGVFWGVTAGISLGAQSTKDITQNVIDVLKLQGIIPHDAQLNINKDLKVTKPVGIDREIKYDIKSKRKTAI